LFANPYIQDFNQLRKDYGREQADAALGYFSMNKKLDDVRVVIEIKDAKTGLEAKQNRNVKTSPVEQAFEYANDMGKNADGLLKLLRKDGPSICSGGLN
jgi:hypothetical protein